MSARPSAKTLRELLHYDHETGLLHWRDRPRSYFENEKICLLWNSRWAGKLAFSSKNRGGYFRGNIFGATYSAHRVAYAIYHGHWPKEQIDHINGVKTDNRICNLRDVSEAVNHKNTPIYKTNNSGVAGVGWNKRDQKWHSRIKVNKKLKHLGYFDVFAEAVSARKEAEIKYGFHENHGRAS